jgi:hypothetical protein
LTPTRHHKLNGVAAVILAIGIFVGPIILAANTVVGQFDERQAKAGFPPGATAQAAQTSLAPDDRAPAPSPGPDVHRSREIEVASTGTSLTHIHHASPSWLETGP